MSCLLSPLKVRRTFDLSVVHLTTDAMPSYGTFRLDMTARLPLDLPAAGTASDQLLLQGV
jgi:hypothetical protein